MKEKPSLIDQWEQKISPLATPEQLAWIKNKLNEVGEKVIGKLVQVAVEKRQHAHAPHSHYLVGAAIRTKQGAEYSGFNIEGKVYTDVICADALSLFTAVNNGVIDREGRQFLDVMVVVTENGGMPCGGCRSKIDEFSDNALIISALPNGEVFLISSTQGLIGSDAIPTMY